ncbi:hypothetical protein LTR66_004566 [Elasticomyces elasticus]|nr:hypothetical protein LTR66_004566 [Elasticomyces elasticus]
MDLGASPQRIPKLTYRNRVPDSETRASALAPPVVDHASTFRGTQSLPANSDSRWEPSPAQTDTESILSPPFSRTPTDFSTNDIAQSPASDVAQALTKVGKKKSMGRVFGFLSLKEPSTAALEEYARHQQTLVAEKEKNKRQQDGTAESRGVTVRTAVIRISPQKLPPDVPKVNSKWDGMPASTKGKDVVGSRRGSAVSGSTIQGRSRRTSAASSRTGGTYGVPRKHSIESDKATPQSPELSQNQPSSSQMSSTTLFGRRAPSPPEILSPQKYKGGPGENAFLCPRSIERKSPIGPLPLSPRLQSLPELSYFSSHGESIPITPTDLHYFESASEGISPLNLSPLPLNYDKQCTVSAVQPCPRRPQHILPTASLVHGIDDRSGDTWSAEVGDVMIKSCGPDVLAPPVRPRKESSRDEFFVGEANGHNTNNFSDKSPKGILEHQPRLPRMNSPAGPAASLRPTNATNRTYSTANRETPDTYTTASTNASPVFSAKLENTAQFLTLASTSTPTTHISTSRSVTSITPGITSAQRVQSPKERLGLGGKINRSEALPWETQDLEVMKKGQAKSQLSLPNGRDNTRKRVGLFGRKGW